MHSVVIVLQTTNPIIHSDLYPETSKIHWELPKSNRCHSLHQAHTSTYREFSLGPAQIKFQKAPQPFPLPELAYLFDPRGRSFQRPTRLTHFSDSAPQGFDVRVRFSSSESRRFESLVSSVHTRKERKSTKSVLTDEGDVGHAVLLVMGRAAGLLGPGHGAACLQLDHVAVPLVEGHAHVAALAAGGKDRGQTRLFLSSLRCWGSAGGLIWSIPEGNEVSGSFVADVPVTESPHFIEFENELIIHISVRHGWYTVIEYVICLLVYAMDMFVRGLGIQFIAVYVKFTAGNAMDRGHIRINFISLIITIRRLFMKYIRE